MLIDSAHREFLNKDQWGRVMGKLVGGSGCWSWVGVVWCDVVVRCGVCAEERMHPLENSVLSARQGDPRTTARARAA